MVTSAMTTLILHHGIIGKTGQYKESNSGEKWNEQFVNDA